MAMARMMTSILVLLASLSDAIASPALMICGSLVESPLIPCEIFFTSVIIIIASDSETPESLLDKSDLIADWMTIGSSVNQRSMMITEGIAHQSATWYPW